MRFIYFAWLREKIGKGQEEIDIDCEIETVAQLLDFLSQRGENYAAVLRERELVRVALDKIHTEHDAYLNGAREVALFPPMTGG